MPTKHRVALTDDVYEALMELKEKWGLESPNQVIRELIKRVTLSERDLSESNHGVTPRKSDGVTLSEATLANGVTPTKSDYEEEAVGAWSPLCVLWDRIKDRVEYSEYLYNEFRKLLESLLPGFNSNELIEEFETCGIIEVSGNVVRVKR